MDSFKPRNVFLQGRRPELHSIFYMWPIQSASSFVNLNYGLFKIKEPLLSSPSNALFGELEVTAHQYFKVLFSAFICIVLYCWLHFLSNWPFHVAGLICITLHITRLNGICHWSDHFPILSSKSPLCSCILSSDETLNPDFVSSAEFAFRLPAIASILLM